MEMPGRGPRLLVAATLLVAASLTTQFALGRKKDTPPAAMPMDAQKRAVHALNRLTFGPRPGDVERVAQIGVNKWIDLQLHPDKIDDSALDARLAPFRTLNMGTKEIVENFPPEQVIRQIADGKASMPRDPTKRAVYEAQLQRYEDKKERKQDAAKGNAATAAGQDASAAGNDSNNNADGSKDDGGKPDDPDQMQRREKRRIANLKAQELLDLPADERMKQILQMSPEEQRALASTRGAKGDALTDGMSPKQKETVMALNNPQQVVVNE